MTEGMTEAMQLGSRGLRLAPPFGADVAPEGPAGLAGAISALEAREAESRQRVRDLRREADALRLRAERDAAALELRTRALEDAHRREDALRGDLREAEARIRKLDAAAAEADARLTEMALERSRLATEIAAVERDRDREAHRAGLREQELVTAREQVKELRRDRRRLEARSARLERLEASRGHRAIQRFWRIRQGMLRPFRVLRRGEER